MVERVFFKTGEVIFNENEHSSFMYILNSGKVAIFKGTEKISEINSPGTLLGEMSLFLGERRTATVIAMSNVELEKIKKDEIQKRILNPDFALSIIEALAEKLNATSKIASNYHKYMETLNELEILAKDNKEFIALINKAKEIENSDNDRIKEMFNFKSLLTKKIINPFIEQTNKSIKTILSIESQNQEAFKFGLRDINIDAASIVNIKGEYKGVFVLGFPKTTAIRMTSVILDQEHNELDEEVVNFIMELNNVVIGLIVSSINEFKFDIGTPTTIFNKETLNNMISVKPALVVPFVTELGEFYAIFSLELIK
jgi:CheY-specific phosphatase CheX